MKRYNVVINGVATTIQLSDAEAAKRGLLVKAAIPRNKAKTPVNKSRKSANA